MGMGSAFGPKSMSAWEMASFEASEVLEGGGRRAESLGCASQGYGSGVNLSVLEE